jgi:hypothetical protein
MSGAKITPDRGGAFGHGEAEARAEIGNHDAITRLFDAARCCDFEDCLDHDMNFPESIPVAGEQ